MKTSEEITYTAQQYKERLIASSKKALETLLTVIEEPIITNTEEDVSSDRLKNSVQTKKIAIFDYLEILTRIDAEQKNLSEDGKKVDTGDGFAEIRSR